jgi:hypothetical protein
VDREAHVRRFSEPLSVFTANALRSVPFQARNQCLYQPDLTQTFKKKFPLAIAKTPTIGEEIPNDTAS